MTSRLVVNADDFGRSAPINQGIIEAHQKGIVTSASLMTDREGFEEAVRLAKANPKLGIGLHLDLDSFFEVEHGVGRLVAYKDPALPIEAIAKETDRQIVKAKGTGLPILHLDGHHHSHLRPEIIGTVGAIAASHKIPVIRYFSGFYKGLYPGVPTGWIKETLERFGFKMVDTFFAGWEPVTSSLPGYEYVNWDLPFKTAELMVHPGKGETWRERELQHCQSSDVREKLKSRSIALATFGDLL